MTDDCARGHWPADVEATQDIRLLARNHEAPRSVRGGHLSMQAIMSDTDRLAHWRRALHATLARWRLRWTRRTRGSAPGDLEHGHPYRDNPQTRRRHSRPSRLDDGDILLLAPVLYWVGLALVARPDAPMLWVAGAGAPLLVLVLSAMRDRQLSNGERTSSQPTQDVGKRDSKDPR